ncbi:MAG: hypothetical protein ACK41D_04210 [Rubricoccaceae bacterium]
MNPFDLPDADELPLFRDDAPGGRARFGRRDAARRAFEEFYVFVAVAERVEDVRPSDLLRIGRRHGVDLAEHFLAERAALYERYVEALAENVLSPPAEARLAEDRARLQGFAAALHLPAEEVHAAHGRAFGRLALRAVAGLHLDAAERSRLGWAQRALGLDAGVARAAYEALAREQLVLALARLLADGRFSAADAEDLARAQEALGATLPAELQSLAAQTRGTVSLPRSWALGFRLGSGEQLYAVVFGRWQRVLVGRLAAALGHGEEPRLEKQLAQLRRTARMGFPENALHGPVSVGRVAVTSRRLLLLPLGARRRVWPLAELRGVVAFAEGVLFYPAGRRHGVFAALDEQDAACVVNAARTAAARGEHSVRVSGPE